MNELTKECLDDNKKFYKDMMNEFGEEDARAYGWGSDNSLIKRYRQFDKYVNLINKNIVEFGCGFFNIHKAINISDFKSYIGYDINSEVIEKCKNSFKYDNVEFESLNLDDYIHMLNNGFIKIPSEGESVFLMSGVLCNRGINCTTGVKNLCDTLINLSRKFKYVCVNFPSDFSDVRCSILEYVSIASVIPILNYHNVNYIYEHGFHEDDCLIIKGV